MTAHSTDVDAMSWPAVGSSVARAVDSHAHVFRFGLTLAEGRRYAPKYDATSDRYLAVLDAHQISHAVLVQPSFLGTDNTFLLATLATHRSRLRGVAVVEPDIDDRRLRKLIDGGIVGVRLNLIGMSVPDLCSSKWAGFFRLVAAYSLHVELHCEARQLPSLVPALLDAEVDLVVDHFGRPEPQLGLADPGFRFLLQCAASQKVWVKLSASYRIGPNSGKSFVSDIVGSLVHAFGTRRLLWGSDWPHTQFESRVTYGETLRCLQTWLPDAEDRRVVLADSPSDIFKFPVDHVPADLNQNPRADDATHVAS